MIGQSFQDRDGADLVLPVRESYRVVPRSTGKEFRYLGPTSPSPTGIQQVNHWTYRGESGFPLDITGVQQAITSGRGEVWRYSPSWL